ncbi:MAG: hypothetical protein ACRETU_00205 [Steroidobacterales bacterium]
MRKIPAGMLLGCLALAVAGAATKDASTSRHDFPAGSGTLQLDVPNEWAAGTTAPAPMGLTSIQFGSEIDPRFQVLLTPFPSIDAQAVEETVKHAAEQIGPQSIEGDPKLEQLSGAQGSGWFFSATDKQYADPKIVPGPGEYKYVTQGTLVVGKIALVFTILTNEDGRAVSDAALAMVKRATLHEATRTT